TGDLVTYSTGGGTAISGLTNGQTYYVIAASSTSIALAESYAEAVDSDVLSFIPSSQVSGNAIFIGSDHGLTTGEPVLYSSNGETALGGLTDGHVYYVILDGDTNVKLAA